VSYHVYHRFGECAADPPIAELDALYGEWAIEDHEHPDVSLGHESGWSLSAFPDGSLVWENVEEDGLPRHMIGVPRDKVIDLWRRLAAGDIAAIEGEPWIAGYS